ncbi:hypothetical protein [Aquimarina litoralis]|uniref:hypothetical protein n=1 Tax=Aquimarina litoralis TaxID=584605 RepID=UPI001C55E410|nr:hypothetical protein [Aquimarina litoralis]MBW1297015.1 hypothetical protein [Aquimarina litoralis]
MKNQLILAVLFTIITVTGNAQKKIIGTNIEGTNLFISAEAETISKVTFKIKKNINESIEEIPEFTLNPFTKYSFKVEINSIFKKLKDSIDVLELKKKGLEIEKEFENVLKSTIESKEGTPSYYQNKTKLNSQIDNLYTYFNSQLVLIFKYDNEPIAGRLHYNTDVKRIQYFPNNSYETYFNNRTRNHHRLIKELYLIRKNYKEAKETLDIEKLNDSKALNANSNEEVDLNNTVNIDSQCNGSGKRSENHKNLISDYINKIRSHFSSESREYRARYIQEPNLFLCRYGDIINSFRDYNRNKRMELIKERLLLYKNQEIYDQIESSIKPYEKFKGELSKTRSLIQKLKDLMDLLNRKEKIIEYITDENKSIEDEIKMLSRRITNIKNNVDGYEISFNNFIQAKDDLKGKNIKIENALDDSVIKTYPDLMEIQNDYFRNLKKFKNLESDLITLRLERDSDGRNYLEKERENVQRTMNTLLLEIKEMYNQFYLNDLDINEINKEEISDILSTLKKGEKEISEKYKKLRNNILSELKKAPLWEFSAKDIQLDINDGFVEHIVVLGNITVPTRDNDQLKYFNTIIEEVLESSPDTEINTGKELKFVNQFPYGFSSSKDFDDFKQYKLYVYNGKHKQFEMKLEYLFPNYIQTLQNDRLDFSPRDQVVKLPIDSDTQGSKELKKDKSSKLFSLSAYSDFNGLKETDPNGVIQFEVNKLIPLYTKRRTSLFGERYINRGFNYGYLNYINPQFRWSRLNANNDDKNLTLSYLPVFNGTSTDSLSYVTQLDLLRHENISVGADLNIFSFDLPTSKMRLEVNASGRYARTRVLDTRGRPVNGQNANNETISNIVQTFNLNTWRFYPEFILRLRPEERYGANLALRPIRFNTVTDGFSNISSEEAFTSNLSDDKQWLHQVEINAHFSPSGRKDDRFFFRYRYTNTSTWEYNGFSEIQVGYSMSLKF